MTRIPLIDDEPWARPFLANQLERLAQMIVSQTETLLQKQGIELPARSISSMIFIGEQENTSVAEIARYLNHPHQLVTQRIDGLINLGIVERVIDENDRRQKNLAFTKKGFSQYRKLKKHLNNQIITYTDLFDEIECDLSEVILSTMDRIEKWTLPERQKTRM